MSVFFSNENIHNSGGMCAVIATFNVRLEKGGSASWQISIFEL